MMGNSKFSKQRDRAKPKQSVYGEQLRHARNSKASRVEDAGCHVVSSNGLG